MGFRAQTAGPFSLLVQRKGAKRKDTRLSKTPSPSPHQPDKARSAPEPAGLVQEAPNETPKEVLGELAGRKIRDSGSNKLPRFLADPGLGSGEDKREGFSR